MKKFLFIFVFISFLFNTVYATNVDVQLNGNIIDFTDNSGNKVTAQIINDRTMVPMRKIFELLDAQITWDDAQKKVIAVKDNITIILQIGNEEANVIKNGITEKISLDSKPVIINNRTLVPLRFISESLGKIVAWDAENKTAIIIDCDYFENRIKEKSLLLYEVIANKNSKECDVTITRKYIDILDNTKNNTSVIEASISELKDNIQNINIKLEGNSELFNEIKSEGWSTGNFKIEYAKERN